MTDPPPQSPESPPAGQTESAEPAKEQERDRKTAELEKSDLDAVDELDDASQQELRHTAKVINNIYGGVHAVEALFGSLGSKAARHKIGRLDAAQIDEVIRCYLQPKPFSAALAILTERRIVVLLGEEGAGKRAGALSLIRELAGPTSVISFSPTFDFAQLADYPHWTTGSYVLQDMRGEGKASAEQRFEVERLLRHLRSKDVWLVITADSKSLARTDLEGLTIDWAHPEPQELFEKLLSLSLVQLNAEDLIKAKEHAATLRLPREIADFVGNLGIGVEAAMHSQSDRDRAEVREFFEDQEKTYDQVMAVAAACFAYGLPERVFEDALSRLHRIARELDETEREPSAAEMTLPQVRSLWSGRYALITTTTDADRRNERRVIFRSPHMRAHVIAEIWQRYGYQLLQPLRAWIRELAKDPDADIRIQIAFGLSLLAGINLAEVEESFLNDWSNGIAIERFTAAFTLSMMCVDEAMAPIALETTLRWADQNGARRAITAAIALGGPLGVKYRSQAFSELWHLTTRGAQIATAARNSIALMLGAAEQEPERAVVILRTVREALHWSAKRIGGLALRGVLTTVLTVLKATSFEAKEPVIAGLLRSTPAAVDVIGELLAATLESGPHHHAAVDLLREVFKSLTNDDQALDVAGRLGHAVFSGWPADVQDKLRPQIERGLELSEEDAATARLLMRQFLTGLRP